MILGPQGGIAAGDPFADAVQAGINHPLGNIDVIQLVPDFQLHGSGNDDAVEAIVRFRQGIDGRYRIGTEGKEGVLIGDAVDGAGGLKKECIGLGGNRPQGVESIPDPLEK